MRQRAGSLLHLCVDARRCTGTFRPPMPLRASSATEGSVLSRSTCSRQRPVASASFGSRSRVSGCTKSRWNEARGLIVVHKKATSRMTGSGRGVFVLEQQRKNALFLLAWPVRETTLACLEGFRRACQGSYILCPCLTFLSLCFLHLFPQLSLWYPSLRGARKQILRVIFSGACIIQSAKVTFPSPGSRRPI